MDYNRELGEWELRAGRLKLAGAYAAVPAEIVAVHAGLYPQAAPVCNTGCPGAMLTAYQSILRWLRQNSPPLSSPFISPTMKKKSQARFKSDDTLYTPHLLGVAYSNANLTDKAARYILANDPDAEQLFSALPAEAEEGEDEDHPAISQQATDPKAEQAKQVDLPESIDYTKLAAALFDEQERRAGAQTTPEPSDTTESALTVNDDDSNGEGDEDADKPVRLSRANKETLIDYYRTELKAEPAEDATNDELRKAIADHRAATGSTQE